VKIVVQKYGGTSVSTGEKRALAARRVREALQDGYRAALVVSAMGRMGEPYATDTLRLLALQEWDGVPQRELDLIMSCGEVISAVVMAAALNKEGISACALSGPQAGLLTDGCYGEAEVVDCRPDNIRKMLEQNIVPVVAGFQGMDERGELNTLGRGGSDTTAIILGAALQAEKVEIYTDVSGIMTADPRVLKEARVIQQITYGEVCQLAYEGARVIHPRAVEVAMRNNVNVLVKNPEDDGPGTLITGEHILREGLFSTRGRRAVTGIAHTAGLAQFFIELPEPGAARELEIFQRIGEGEINIDLISVFPRVKAFTVKGEYSLKVEEILKSLEVPYRLDPDCAKVSVVGVGMHGIPGVMARVVKALHDQGIKIKQTGDSNITISLLIGQDDLPLAVKTLHDCFQLNGSEA